MSKITKIIISFAISIAIFFSIALNYWVFYIPSESMYPNYFSGDLVVSKALDKNKQIHLGESYTFKANVNGKEIVHIKRLIASEGDTISFRADRNNNHYNIFINGNQIIQERINVSDIPEFQLDAIYDFYGHLDFNFYKETLNGKSYTVMYLNYEKLSDNVINNYLMKNLDFTLGENENFFMGDNRNQSADSRSYGVISTDKVIYGTRSRLIDNNFSLNINNFLLKAI